MTFPAHALPPPRIGLQRNRRLLNTLGTFEPVLLPVMKTKLNNHLIELMEKKELIGISLKKIESGGSFKLFNVDSSKLLTNLKTW